MLKSFYSWLRNQLPPSGISIHLAVNYTFYGKFCRILLLKVSSGKLSSRLTIIRSTLEGSCQSRENLIQLEILGTMNSNFIIFPYRWKYFRQITIMYSGDIAFGLHEVKYAIPLRFFHRLKRLRRLGYPSSMKPNKTFPNMSSTLRRLALRPLLSTGGGTLVLYGEWPSVEIRIRSASL